MACTVNNAKTCDLTTTPAAKFTKALAEFGCAKSPEKFARVTSFARNVLWLDGKGVFAKGNQHYGQYIHTIDTNEKTGQAPAVGPHSLTKVEANSVKASDAKTGNDPNEGTGQAPRVGPLTKEEAEFVKTFANTGVSKDLYRFHHEYRVCSGGYGDEEVLLE